MYLFECKGATENHVDHGLKKSLHANQITDGKTIILPENKYNSRSTFYFNMEDSFSFARKHIHVLNFATKSNKSLEVRNKTCHDNSYPRKYICDVFSNVNSLLDYILHLLKYDHERGKVYQIVTTIKGDVSKFRILLKSVDVTSDNIIKNASSVLGNQCSLASYHLFHLHLELLWFIFNIVLKVHTIEEIFVPSTIENTEDQNCFPDQCQVITPKMYHALIEKEIQWLLYNLVAIANKSYYKVGSKNIFTCNCIKEIWLSAQILIERLTKESKCNNFWFYFNDVVKKYIIGVGMSEPTAPQHVSIYKMSAIESSRPLEFSMWLLLNVTQLQGYEESGQFMGPECPRVASNYELLEYILKRLTSNEESVPEITFREQMNHVNKLMIEWWEPKSDIIMLLWEYFHKRFNSPFIIPGRDDSGTSLHSSPVPEIISDLKSHFSLDFSLGGNSKCESSFSLFIALLGIYLKRSFTSNQLSNCQKMKGRILPKFNINKILTLNGSGLNNFSIMYLVLAMSTEITGICLKLQELLVQLPFDTLPFNKKQIVVNTHLCVIYLHIENCMSIRDVAKPLSSILATYTSSRDAESMSLLRSVIRGIDSVMDISTDFSNDEYLLIDSWISKYLAACPVTDLSNTLETFGRIISKLTIISSYADVFDERFLSLIDVLFVHIFNPVKTLYSNGGTAEQIADVAFLFMKFSIGNQTHCKKYGTFEEILKYFMCCESPSDKTSRQLLHHILKDEQISVALEEEKKLCEAFIVHCWIRTTLLGPQLLSEEDALLMHMICQLKELTALKISQVGGFAQKRNLCQFFHSIGVVWNSTQSFQEKCFLRERVTQYLHLMDRHVVRALKVPPNMEYVMQIFMVLGALFLHCSSIIYSRANPNCLLHCLVSSVLLPPQLFMEKKIHPYITSGVCKSWFIFMKGLHHLDFKNDSYIDKIMKDMIVQYLPYFANKTLSTYVLYDIPYKIIPNDANSDMLLEKYILDKISLSFITCRGRQCHTNAHKALSIIQNLVSSAELCLLHTIISSTMTSVYEQLMFSDPGNPNKKAASLILETICNSNHFKTSPADCDIKSALEETLKVACSRHMAFNSNIFFKLLTSQSAEFAIVVKAFVPFLQSEIEKVEKMRGVGYDLGLRNGLKEVISYTDIKLNKQNWNKNT